MNKPIECLFCHEFNSYYDVDLWGEKGYIKCYSCGTTGPKVDLKHGVNSKVAKSLWMKAVK